MKKRTPEQYLEFFKVRFRLTLSKPFLLVCAEKHGDRYYHCQTVEDLLCASWAVVKERFSEGCYTASDGGAATAELAELEKSLKEMEAGSMAWKLVEERAAPMRRREKERMEEKALEEQARKCVEEKDGAAALMILEARSKYQYEGFFLEEYSHAEW